MKAPPVTARDYLRLIFRRKYVLLAPIALGILLIFPLWSAIPPKYRAVALVRRSDSTLTSNAAGNLIAPGMAPAPINALRVEILTWTNLLRVIRMLNLDANLNTAADWEQQYDSLQKAITVHAAAEGHGVALIEISAVHSDPASAKDIANAVAHNYVEESLQAAQQETRAAVAFFREGAAENLKKLRAVESELDRFAQESAGRFELQSQLAQRKKVLAAMRVNYLPQHPQLKAVESDVAAIEAQLGRLADQEKRYSDLERMRKEYQEMYELYQKSLLATEARLQAQNGAHGTQVEILAHALLPTTPWRMERMLIVLYCLGAGVAAGIALMFLLEMLDYSLRGAEDSAVSLDIPVLATLVKISPQEKNAPRPRASRKGPGDDHAAAPANRIAPARTGMPMPFQRTGDRWETPTGSVLIFHDRNGQFAAQMRALRAKLLAPRQGAAPRVITVTSGSPQEGKSTVAANLAVAFSEVESGRVLLVDGDLLRPSLHRVMNVRVESGLREILTDSLVLDRHVYETAIPNLDLLPAPGIGAEGGLEAPMHQRCAQLVAALRQFYSYVIIDTPPVLSSSQAASFAKNSDGVILVARLEKTPRQVVQRSAAELAASGGKVLGCVLTCHTHHVPNLIYRFLGTTPKRYYHYDVEAADGPAVPAPRPASVARPEV